MSNALELGSDFVVGTDIWGRECEAAEKGVRFLGYVSSTTTSTSPLYWSRNINVVISIRALRCFLYNGSKEPQKHESYYSC